MKAIINLSLILYFVISTLNAQTVVKVNILEEDRNVPILDARVSINGQKLKEKSNFDGLIEIKNIKTDTIEISISKDGYQLRRYTLTSPFPKGVELYLKPITSSTIEIAKFNKSKNKNLSAVEVIKQVSKEGNVISNTTDLNLILNGIGGLNIQPVSLLIGEKQIRIHGFHGHYTQILRDGFPIYEDLARVLSVNQISTLDIERVEINKGGILNYGGEGFNAGTINLVSKEPSQKPQFDAILSQTQKGGSSLGAFYARKNRKLGVSIHALGSLQKLFDVNNDMYSDFPKTEKVLFSPKFYIDLNEKSKLNIFLDGIVENRQGGHIDAINEYLLTLNRPLFQMVNSSSFSSRIFYKNQLSNIVRLEIKNSVSYNKRIVEELFLIPEKFNQLSSFSELNFFIDKKKISWLFGGKFQFIDLNSFYEKRYRGLFVGNNFKISKYINAETNFKFTTRDENHPIAQLNAKLFFCVNEYFEITFGGIIGEHETSAISLFNSRFSFSGVNFRDYEEEGIRNLNITTDYKRDFFNGLKFTINTSIFANSLKNPFILNDSKFFVKEANAKEENYGLDTKISIQTSKIEANGCRTNFLRQQFCHQLNQ